MNQRNDNTRELTELEKSQLDPSQFDWDGAVDRADYCFDAL